MYISARKSASLQFAKKSAHFSIFFHKSQIFYFLYIFRNVGESIISWENITLHLLYKSFVHNYFIHLTLSIFFPSLYIYILDFCLRFFWRVIYGKQFLIKKMIIGLKSDDPIYALGTINSPESIISCITVGFFPSTVHPTELQVPNISLTVPLNSLALDFTLIFLATS